MARTWWPDAAVVAGMERSAQAAVRVEIARRRGERRPRRGGQLRWASFVGGSGFFYTTPQGCSK